METNKKKIIIYSIIIVISLVLIIVMLNKKDDNNIESESIFDTIDDKLIEEKTVEFLDIYNVSLYIKNNMTYYYATVKNNTNESQYISNLYVVLVLDDSEKKISIMNDEIMDGNYSRVVSFDIDYPYDNIKEVKYILEK